MRLIYTRVIPCSKEIHTSGFTFLHENVEVSTRELALHILKHNRESIEKNYPEWNGMLQHRIEVTEWIYESF